MAWNLRDHYAFMLTDCLGKSKGKYRNHDDDNTVTLLT